MAPTSPAAGGSTGGGAAPLFTFGLCQPLLPLLSDLCLRLQRLLLPALELSQKCIYFGHVGGL